MKSELDRELVLELQGWQGVQLLTKAQDVLYKLKSSGARLDAVPDAKGVFFPEAVSFILIHMDFES